MRYQQFGHYSEIAIGVITVVVSLCAMLLIVSLFHLISGRDYLDSVDTLATVITAILSIIIAGANAALAYCAWKAAKSFQTHNTFSEAKSLYTSLFNYENHVYQFYDRVRISLALVTCNVHHPFYDKNEIKVHFRKAKSQFDNALNCHLRILKDNEILRAACTNLHNDDNKQFRVSMNEIMNTVRSDAQSFTKLFDFLEKYYFGHVYVYHEEGKFDIELNSKTFLCEKEKIIVPTSVSNSSCPSNYLAADGDLDFLVRLLEAIEASDELNKSELDNKTIFYKQLKVGSHILEERFRYSKLYIQDKVLRS